MTLGGSLKTSVCLCLYLSPSVCLSVCLPACLSACLPACLPVCLSVCLSLPLPPSLSLCSLFLCLHDQSGEDGTSETSLCLCVSLFICLSLFCIQYYTKNDFRAPSVFFGVYFLFVSSQYTWLSSADKYAPFRPEDVPLVAVMYLVFTRIPGESYRRRARSLRLVGFLGTCMWRLVGWFL